MPNLPHSKRHFQRAHFLTLPRDRSLWFNLKASSSSETLGLLAGTLRRAPENLLLPNQFQKWSNSVPLIGQKNIFVPNQRGSLAGYLCRLLRRSSFLHRLALSTGRSSWRVLEENIQRSRGALIWGLGANILPSIFSADLSKVFFVTPSFSKITN